MAQPTMHTGSCHCGKVRYQVELDLSQPVIACNCSICQRSGSLLAFVPAAKFELLSGESDLKDYQFNKHAIHHMFCSNCGIKSFARGQMPDGSPMAAINVRCLEDVEDVEKLSIKHFDGRSR